MVVSAVGTFAGGIVSTKGISTPRIDYARRYQTSINAAIIRFHCALRCSDSPHRTCQWQCGCRAEQRTVGVDGGAIDHFSSAVITDWRTECVGSLVGSAEGGE